MLLANFLLVASYGVQIPGRQDLKFKQYDTNGNLTEYLKTTYVFSAISSMRNLHLTYWQHRFGLRLEYLKWEHNSTAKKYLIDQVPEFNTTEEPRGGIFIMGLMRTRFPFKKTKDNSFINKSYSYFGFGYGVVKTEINHGKQAYIKSGLQATCGITIPIDNYLRYAPILEMYIADISGVKAKNHWFDQTKNLTVAIIISDFITYKLKKRTRKRRPNGDNVLESFPSGHTSFAFTNASVLFEEYKQTEPLLAYSGYAFAAITGAFRIVNNAHWLSDVLVSAGIGILITKLVY